jgi:hypothetical protein
MGEALDKGHPSVPWLKAIQPPVESRPTLPIAHK